MFSAIHSPSKNVECHVDIEILSEQQQKKSHDFSRKKFNSFLNLVKRALIRFTNKSFEVLSHIEEVEKNSYELVRCNIC